MGDSVRIIDPAGEGRGFRGGRTKESAMMVLRPAAIVKVGTLAVVTWGICYVSLSSFPRGDRVGRISQSSIGLIVLERGGYRVCWIVTDFCCMSIAQPLGGSRADVHTRCG